MTLDEVLENNLRLQAEAARLLDAIKLVDKLTPYGSLQLEGSYVYGTMVDRDIDLTVSMRESDINLSSRSEIMTIFMQIPECVEMRMSDRKSHPKPHRPKGIWFGPSILFEGNIWNMDIWLQSDSDTGHGASYALDLHKRMLSATDEQKKVILMIKNQALLGEEKKKGVTSAEVYQAVLDNSVTTYEEYVKSKS
jgi:hypothetical protein